LLGSERPQLLYFANGRWNALVMPGLDPGIRQNQNVLQERWIAGSADKFTNLRKADYYARP
jgi:hypothetical protein